MPNTPPATAPAPSVHAEGVSNDEFRAALSRLAAGVVLVTAHEPQTDPDGPRGEDVGMTATSFMSVSLDPPLVLVGLREGSRMDDLLDEQPLWAVSFLSEGQSSVASRFAMKNRISDRLLFADVPHVTGKESGAPLLAGALATLECRTEQRVTAGDHTLVIGRVLTSSLPGTDGSPLTYFRGRYRKLG
ncbi:MULTISPECIES: flavin reductase family protein [Streptomyces]|uniref:Flavin reductase n=1 Tax=Streptomyces apricus TaxID=1828112 RepID=A0A5B0BQ04_9ACTN|nr:flavin reductase family protein [Streptomyces apricus]KAA0942915.1 flavin reductase [Streptomyces apricus]